MAPTLSRKRLPVLVTIAAALAAVLTVAPPAPDHAAAAPARARCPAAGRPFGDSGPICDRQAEGSALPLPAAAKLAQFPRWRSDSSRAPGNTM